MLSLETAASDSDGTEESSKESSDDDARIDDMSRKACEGLEEKGNNDTRSVQLSARDVEGLDEQYGTGGEAGPFCNAVSDAEE